MSGSIGQSSPGDPGIKVVNFHDMHSENSFVCRLCRLSLFVVCRCWSFVIIGGLLLFVVLFHLSLFVVCRCLLFVVVCRLSFFVVCRCWSFVIICCCLSFVVVGCCLSFVVLCQESVVQVIRGVQGVQVAQVV